MSPTLSPRHGIVPFAGAGLGTLDFRPTPGGGEGLLPQARATYYYTVGGDYSVLCRTSDARAQFRQLFYLAPDFETNYLTIHAHTTTFEPGFGFYAPLLADSRPLPLRCFTIASAGALRRTRGFTSMMSLPLLFAIVIVVLYLVNSINILKEYERGVIFRLGRVKQAAAGPGVIWSSAPSTRSSASACARRRWRSPRRTSLPATTSP